MTTFFPDADYLLLLCGVMHLFLAAVCETVRKQNNVYASYKWIVFFGVLHAVADWMKIIGLTDDRYLQRMHLPWLLLAAAYGSLFYLARNGLAPGIKKKRAYWVLSVSTVPFSLLMGCHPLPVLAKVLGFLAMASSASVFVRGACERKRYGMSGVLFGVGLALYVVSMLGDISLSFVLTETVSGIRCSGITELIQGSGAVLIGLAIWKNSTRETPAPCLKRQKPDILFVGKMLSGLAAILIGGWFITKAVTDYTDRDIRYHLGTRAQTIADCLDRSSIARLTGTVADQETSSYVLLKKQFGELCKLNPDCRFVYLMGRRAGKIVFLVDSEAERSKDYSPPGQIFSQPSKDLLEIFNSGRPFVEGPIRDSWGIWLSGHAPIRGPDDKIIAAVGMDINAADWQRTIALHRLAPVSISMLASMLLIGFMVSLRKSETFSLRIAASEERYRALFNSVNDGIFIHLLSENCVTGRFLEVNETACKQLGYSKDELLDMSFSDIDCNKSELNAVLSDVNQKRQIMFERIFLTKDSRKIWVDVNARIVDLHADRAVIYVVRDVTERRNLESQLVQSQKLESLGQLAAGIAHEVTHPVAFVSSNLQALQEYHADLLQIFGAYARLERQMEEMEKGSCQRESLCQLRLLKTNLDPDFILGDFQNIITESRDGMERIKGIARSLKDFSRMDSEERTLADINEGLKSTLKILWNEIKYKAKVISDYKDIPWIYCYPQQLNQVFLNILANAAQAIQGQGEIRICTGSREGERKEIQIRITDTGKGIPEHDLKNIFEPFFTTKSVGEGTGLGLSIASRIIAKHNGTITVESQVGRGTTFVITLPSNGGESSK